MTASVNPCSQVYSFHVPHPSDLQILLYILSSPNPGFYFKGTDAPSTIIHQSISVVTPSYPMSTYIYSLSLSFISFHSLSIQLVPFYHLTIQPIYFYYLSPFFHPFYSAYFIYISCISPSYTQGPIYPIDQYALCMQVHGKGLHSVLQTNINT